MKNIMKGDYFKRKMFVLALAVFVSVTAFAQTNVKISGVVLSDTNEPLPGVTVIQKGTSNGTTTDLDGAYSLVVPENAVLEASYLGFTTAAMPVQPGVFVYNFTLTEDDKWLEEVVVIGYGIQKKKLITGATVQVKGENIEKLNTVDVLGALQSQSPGVYITQSSGQVGEGFKINIRGLGTTGETTPLYVIDGVAGGSLSSLNPSDIESIDVLKDAASAAIYGARAANGVILVTTKKGKAGKLQITYDGYYGVQNAITNGVTPLNAEQYMEIINKALLTQDSSGGLLYNWEDELPASMLASIKNGSWNGTNWLKEGTNANAPITSHAVNLMGGNEQSRFSLGFSYLMQEGTIGYPATPHYDRYTARMNSDHSLWKKNGRDIIRFGENIVFSNYSRSGVSIGNMYSNNVRNLLKMSPLLPAYNDQGDYYIYKDMVADGWNFEQELNNPLAQLDYTRKNRNSVTRRLQANAFLEIAPLKELKFKSSVGYDYYQNSYRYYVPTYILSSKTTNDTDDVTQGQSWSTNWTWENTLNYSKLFGEHSIDVLVGQSMEKWGNGESVYIKNSNSLFPGSYDHAYISNTQGLDNTNTDISGEPSTAGSLVSFFGRINYNFREKYLLSLVMRADGSSNFARGKRWGYFPSVSAGWILTNEPFMESVTDVMNFFKLRGSWGQNGNCNIDNFQYLATIAFNTSAYFFEDKNTPSTGAYPDILPNADVTWETSEQLDLGFDARFFDSRLGVNFDWYIKTTKDWLVVAPTLLSYGTGAPFINGGDVENRGVELALSWFDKIGNDFQYDINMNFAHNKNNVLRLANEEGIIHGPDQVIAENTTESFRVQVGYPMGYFWGYKTLGVFQNQAQIDKFLAEGGATKQGTPAPGDLIFQDTDENGVIDEKDKTYIGNPHPDFTGSLSLNLSYKGFDFSMTAYGAFGQQIMKCYRSFSDTPNDNYTTDVYTKYWTGEGSTNRYPAFSYGKHENFKDISDIYLEDGDYIKISNVTIGYNFKNVWKNLPASQLRIYVAAQNLFTISNYTGMDPEVGFGGGVSWASGIDNGYYPSSRTFMVGLNLKF
jgi:TonB-dependent starch-binding outer membrane protein SusC